MAFPSFEEVINYTQNSLQLISGWVKSKNHAELLGNYYKLTLQLLTSKG